MWTTDCLTTEIDVSPPPRICTYLGVMAKRAVQAGPIPFHIARELESGSHILV